MNKEAPEAATTPDARLPLTGATGSRQEILEARAKALAIEPLAGHAGEEEIEVVEFLLAHEKYAVESVLVREVYPLKDLTFVPCTPPFVLGIVNVRGQILTVVDIKRFFELPAKGFSDLNKVIIVRAARMELGILADAILGVRRLPLKELQLSLPTLTGIRAEYLRGVTAERTIVLDVARILADEKIIVHEEVEA